MLTRKRLKSLLWYDPSDGEFMWIRTRGTRIKPGTIAGSVYPCGYRYIEIDGIPYKANRLAWFYMKGIWPENFVDHENGNKTDDRWDNLREADGFQNQQNRKLNVNNTSGCPGVHMDKTGKWIVRIGIKGKRIFVGYFEDLDLAVAAYIKAKSIHHTFNPRVRNENADS